MIIMFLLGALLGGLVAYRLGWNGAVRLYERRTIEQARQRAEQDRK